MRRKSHSISEIGVPLSEWRIYKVLVGSKYFKQKSQSEKLQVICCHEDRCIGNVTSVENYFVSQTENRCVGRLQKKKSIHWRVSWYLKNHAAWHDYHTWKHTTKIIYHRKRNNTCHWVLNNSVSHPVITKKGNLDGTAEFANFWQGLRKNCNMYLKNNMKIVL